MVFVTKGKQYSRYVGRSCEIACFCFSKTNRFKAMAPIDQFIASQKLLLKRHDEVVKHK